MTDAHAKAVEAAAGAVVRALHRFEVPTVTAQAAIADYLATMAEAGWVMVRDVAEHDTDVHGNPYSGYRDGEGSIEYAYSNGWNDCRAAMLKGDGDGQG